jgi:hypothetical protein
MEAGRRGVKKCVDRQELGRTEFGSEEKKGGMISHESEREENKYRVRPWADEKQNKSKNPVRWQLTSGAARAAPSLSRLGGSLYSSRSHLLSAKLG